MNAPRIENAGLGGWLVRLFDTIDEANLPWVTALARQCESAFGPALVDLVPSYTTLLVQYDPLMLTPDQAQRRLQSVLAELAPDESDASGSEKELPVWYDPSVGPDLPTLADARALGLEQLVALHTQTTYRVFALGFAPGFAFMGSLDPRLEAPRLATPRPRVPRGSVAIAGRQTSAYPAVSPGGWNLLGRTPVTLFDRHRHEMSYLQVGDRVRMVPVSREEFLRLGGDTTPLEAS
ncbi:MAG: 5-oxoprolinase subunit PxpB [Pseudomonadales bacterium]|uniref:5-oxoprolinase subunit PxpB n=1 Tax=Marinobacter xestospongiae TaxID=994319 RepID=UPI0020057B8D|nr:5-oxoprolinase subunit PxpB [Marinobacter xestospongiae]MCG8517776.1 5-oxoprolinase subunit PxpB [Pseudomonadales bacterium]MCK7565538.1 5-oxoprolinase subunit PxpB [Marinobacter xestospongiae]